MAKEQLTDWTSIQQFIIEFFHNYADPHYLKTVVNQNPLYARVMKSKEVSSYDLSSSANQRAEELIAFLSACPNIANICMNPTVLNWVCHVANGRLLDERRTVKDIYDKLIFDFIHIYLKNVHSIDTNYYSCYDLIAAFQYEFAYLMPLAFNNLFDDNNVLLFDTNTLRSQARKSQLDLSESNTTLELLLKEQLLASELICPTQASSSKAEATEAYVFADNSVRNYFAARHIAIALIENRTLQADNRTIKPLDFIEEKLEDARYQGLFPFIAGFLVDKDLSKQKAQQEACLNDFFTLLASTCSTEKSPLGPNTIRLIRCWNETYTLNGPYPQKYGVAKFTPNVQAQVESILFSSLDTVRETLGSDTANAFIDALRLAPLVMKIQPVQDYFAQLLRKSYTLQEKYSSKRRLERLQAAYILYRLGQPLADNIVRLFFGSLNYEHALLIVFIHLLSKEVINKKREECYEKLTHETFEKSYNNSQGERFSADLSFQRSLNTSLPEWFDIPLINEPELIAFIKNIFINACKQVNGIPNSLLNFESVGKVICDFINNSAAKVNSSTPAPIRDIYEVYLLAQTLTFSARTALMNECSKECKVLGIEPKIIFSLNDGRDNSEAESSTKGTMQDSSASTVELAVKQHGQPSSIFRGNPVPGVRETETDPLLTEENTGSKSTPKRRCPLSCTIQ